MYKKTKLVFGVGINDADYVTQKYEIINGKQKQTWICPYYKYWRSMLYRRYSVKYHNKFPTYKECFVHERWLKFTTFSEWMKLQDWKGMHLDKDILSKGNKIYSEDNCVFVTVGVNNFVLDVLSARGDYPLGVSFSKRTGNFMARCNNPFTGEKDYLGMYDNPEDAHRAWKKRKHELALIYADMQTDERIADALRLRYADY